MFFKEFASVTYSIKSSIKLLTNRQVAHTTPPIGPECGRSMTEARGNGNSTKLLPGYLWRERERNGNEGPTASNSTLLHIAELRSEYGEIHTTVNLNMALG